jgi:hypothetical protein
MSAEIPQFYVEQEIAKINDLIKHCDSVEKTITSDGWKNIIGPLLDKMITDITGGKLANGKWVGGLLDRARKDERREFYIGYKQALIDLHTRINAYPNNAKVLKDKRESLIRQQKNDKTSIPMVDDTRYGRDLNG